MGFLRDAPAVEAWLRRGSSAFRPLTQREYQTLVAQWRARFEGLLRRQRAASGAKAEVAALSSLPADASVFSIPGYRFLPAATDPQLDRAYGYQAEALHTVDFEVANNADAIVTDVGLTFTCLCTHETGAFAEPMFALITTDERDEDES